MDIIIPDNAAKILNVLNKAGYEAYVVGGCVRDSVLGIDANDWDITTNAEPLKVKELFARTFDTGLQHGTVSVLMDREIYEVTTYRVDGEYEDGRHPKKVTFTPSLEEDLKRRDFTINAMAYNPKRGLVDLFGGVSDLEAGIIRCVGDPVERFSEDALRIMRAVRFAARFNFEIEEKTRKAIKKLAGNLKKISAERIQVELVKLLTSDHPEMIRTAYELGITKVVLPEFDKAMETEQDNPHHCYTVGEHTIKVLEGVPNDRVLRITALLHDLGKPATKTFDKRGIAHYNGHPEVGAVMSRDILRRLKFDNDTIEKVSRLITYHDWTIHADASKIRHEMHRMGLECFPEIFTFNIADLHAQSEFRRKEKEDNIALLRKAYEEVMERGDCVCLKQLAVNGGDLIKAGMQPGKEIGTLLEEMLSEVLDDPSKNDKEYLIAKYVKG